jgi:hypothetical protein
MMSETTRRLMMRTIELLGPDFYNGADRERPFVAIRGELIGSLVAPWVLLSRGEFITILCGHA